MRFTAGGGRSRRETGQGLDAGITLAKKVPGVCRDIGPAIKPAGRPADLN